MSHIYLMGRGTLTFLFPIVQLVHESMVNTICVMEKGLNKCKKCTKDKRGCYWSGTPMANKGKAPRKLKHRSDSSQWSRSRVILKD